MEKTNLHIVNRKAGFEYHLLQKFTAGIQLLGTEIKSVRAGNVNISEAFCFFKPAAKGETGELFIRNMNIGSFKQASYNNHEPLRLRKLLLSRAELRKLQNKASDKGLAIIPLRLFLSETGYAKLEIAIGQGKKSFDKRESIKARDVQRDIARGTD